MISEPFVNVVLPLIPPTTNHAYVVTPSLLRNGKVVKHGTKRLSEEGEKFKQEAKYWLSQNALHLMKDMVDTKAYWVRITLLVPILNKGYPKHAAAKFKGFDGTNRIKLLEDVIAEVCGVDDSNFTDVTVSKRQSERNVTVIQIGEVPDATWMIEA